MISKCQTCRRILNEVTGQWEHRELRWNEVDHVSHKICIPCFEKQMAEIDAMKIERKVSAAEHATRS